MATIRARQGKTRTTYLVEIRVAGRRPVRKTFKRKSDAKRWAVDTEADIRNNRYFGSSEGFRRSLAEAVERYIDELSPDGNWKHHLEYWKDTLGELRLCELTPPVIAEQRGRLRREETHQSARRAPATVNRYLGSLSHLFTIASREWGWLEVNPVSKVRRDVFGTGEPPVPPPLFLGDELAARAFVDAIVNLFNAGFGCNVLCAYVGEIDNTTFLVPYNLFDIGGDAFVSSVMGRGNGAGLWSGGDTFDWARFLQQSNRWALVTESGTVSVPEPSAVTLFALGLLGLGFARHRRA